MAIFGKLDVVEQQIKSQKFTVAFEYLKKAMITDTLEHNRLFSYSKNTFEKIELDENNFALEQVYTSKDGNDCFFESHKQYTDVQFILKGEEVIEVVNTKQLAISMPYDKTMDLIKYNTTKEASQIVLKKGDVAIFYPQDAHMPCVKLNKSVKVIKTVVKVAI